MRGKRLEHTARDGMKKKAEMDEKERTIKNRYGGGKRDKLKRWDRREGRGNR